MSETDGESFLSPLAAARPQTTDAGAPVSPYTVVKELGHGSPKPREEAYGHRMEPRSRSAEVEFREAEVINIERAR